MMDLVVKGCERQSYVSVRRLTQTHYNNLDILRVTWTSCPAA